MRTLRLRTAGNRTGWLSLFSGAGKGLLALLLLSFSFAAKAQGTSKNFYHWADLTATWDNGNLNKSKSSYKEGDIVPHLYTPEGLVQNTQYTITIKYDYQLLTKKAGGFNEFVLDPASFSKTPTAFFLNESGFPAPNGTGAYAPYYATNITINSITPKEDEKLDKQL